VPHEEVPPPPHHVVAVLPEVEADIRERETLERAARELAARRTMGDDRA
jgi:hypothetical protein